LEHGSIFTSSPLPENPPKRYCVENVQKNYLSLLFVEWKTEILVLPAGSAAYTLSTEVGSFTPRFRKKSVYYWPASSPLLSASWKKCANLCVNITIVAPRFPIENEKKL
jgi:hypothetical protein